MKNLIGLFLFLSLGLVSCSDDEDQGPQLTRINLSSDQTDIVVGKSITITATGVDQFGDVYTLDPNAIEWASSGNSASVDQSGNVTAVEEGSATITATSLGVTGDIELTVQAKPELTTLKIVPDKEGKIDLGEVVAYNVVGYDQYNDEIEYSSAVSWSASNNNVSVDADGNITGVSVGESVITATVDGVTATYNVKVWDSSAPRTEIYVSDAAGFNSGPYYIYRYNEDGSEPTTFIDEELAWPQAIVFLESDEIILVSNLNTNKITKYDINSGEYLGDFATGLSGPTRMKIGADNMLYVLQWRGNGKVLRYQLDGAFVDEFTSQVVTFGIGMDWDEAGNLYVSSYNNGANGYVRKFSDTGEDLGLFIQSSLDGPTNVWFDGTDLYVNDWTSGEVKRFDKDGAYQGKAVTGLSNPEGYAKFDDGNVLIGNGGTSAIKLFDSEYNYIKDLINKQPASLKTPNAVVIRKVNF